MPQVMEGRRVQEACDAVMMSCDVIMMSCDAMMLACGEGQEVEGDLGRCACRGRGRECVEESV